MMPNTIVITMAGRGSRFYEAGYKVPKYEIEAHGHSLFYWSILSLKNFISSETLLVFVCLKENNSVGFVKDQCNKLGYKNVKIIELQNITDGQATSAYVSRDFWPTDSSLLIYNIDTFVSPNALNYKMIREGSDGWIPCMHAPGNHWSFVKLNNNDWASNIAEKNKISDFASIGLYWFARSKDFVEAYENYFANAENLVKGERYIAPLYNYLINDGSNISISNLLMQDVHVLGTPQELETFLNIDRRKLDALID